MSERSIIWTAEEVRAYLAGRKTQHRIPIKGAPVNPEAYLLGVHKGVWGIHSDPVAVAGVWRGKCPMGETGGKVWVRENYTYWEREESIHPLPEESLEKYAERITHNGEDYIKYLADEQLVSFSEWPSIHAIFSHCVGRFDRTIPAATMPHWASRITLDPVTIRVERVQDISISDVDEEGVVWMWYYNLLPDLHMDGSDSRTIAKFREYWRAKHGPESWNANPWVWVAEFPPIDKPILSS